MNMELGKNQGLIPSKIYIKDMMMKIDIIKEKVNQEITITKVEEEGMMDQEIVSDVEEKDIL